MQLEPILAKLLGNQVLSSVVIVIVAIALRIAAKRYLETRTSLEADQRRRVASNVKNALFLLVAIALALIWAPALRTFALSLTAFAVAIIIATKEVILCLSGALVKAATGAMRVGDWISVNTMRGEVIDQSLMSTTIQELGSGPMVYQFTGRTIIIPNSVFLAAPVTNEQFYRRYVFHTISLVSEPDLDIEPVIEAMSDAVRKETAGNEELGRRYKSLIEGRANIDLPDVDGEARLETTNEGRPKLSMNWFLPTKSAIAIERKAIIAGLAVIRRQIAAREQTA